MTALTVARTTPTGAMTALTVVRTTPTGAMTGVTVARMTPTGAMIAVTVARSALGPGGYTGRILTSSKAIPIAVATVTRPGRRKLWFNKYRPICVVPV
jgi:hypothetical protein